jgi:hypothetical protein
VRDELETSEGLARHSCREESSGQKVRHDALPCELSCTVGGPHSAGTTAAGWRLRDVLVLVLQLALLVLHPCSPLTHCLHLTPPGRLRYLPLSFFPDSPVSPVAPLLAIGPASQGPLVSPDA